MRDIERKIATDEQLQQVFGDEFEMARRLPKKQLREALQSTCAEGGVHQQR